MATEITVKFTIEDDVIVPGVCDMMKLILDRPGVSVPYITKRSIGDHRHDIFRE